GGRLATHSCNHGLDIEQRTNQRGVDSFRCDEGVAVPAFWIELRNWVVQFPRNVNLRENLPRTVRGRPAPNAIPSARERVALYECNCAGVRTESPRSRFTSF